MKKIGRRIFYDKRNGEVLAIVGERFGHVRPTTVVEDIASFRKLQERNRETFDHLDLEYGQYKEDFQRATSIAVDLDTKEVVFNFEGIDEEPIYQEPLTEKVGRLEEENEILRESLMESSLYMAMQAERINNQNEAIMEISTMVALSLEMKGGDV